MVIYLTSFVTSIFFFFLSDHTTKTLRKLFAGIGIIIPSLVAALRDETIGTDVTAYTKPIFELSQTSSFADTLNFFYNQPTGFVLLGWIPAHLGMSFSVYLFLIQLFTVAPIYYSIRWIANSTWFGMAAYLLLLFPVSLNMMKQMIACAFVAFAFKYAVKHQLFRFLIGIAAAVLMHQTSILMIILYPLVYSLLRHNTEYEFQKFKVFSSITFILASGVFFIFGNRVIALLGTVRQSYSYLELHQEDAIGITAAPLIFIVFIILMQFLYQKGDAQIDEKRTIISNGISLQSLLYILSLLSIAGWLFQEANIITLGLSRMGYYGLVFMPMYLSIWISENKSSKVNTVLELALITMMAFFFIRNALLGINDIYPYVFSLSN